MTLDQWKEAISPKVDGTWNLHHALQHTKLDFFVVFSSISGICGNTGQANYAAANTFLDSFVHFRRRLGLPASVCALGFVENAGCVSKDPKLLERARSGCVRLIQEKDVMDALQLTISQSPYRLSDGIPDCSLLAIRMSNTKPQSDPGVRSIWTKDARFAMYANIESRMNDGKRTESDDLKKFLAVAKGNSASLDDNKAKSHITEAIGKLITAHMAGADQMDDEQIASVAIDSLMSIEIRSWFRRNLDAEVTLIEINTAATAGWLGKLAIEVLKPKFRLKPQGLPLKKGRSSSQLHCIIPTYS